MPSHILLLVLGAALLHATWNIIVKGGDNKLFESALNALGGGLGALFILPFLPPLPSVCWPYLALSCCCHLTYYICISAAYREVDLSLGYTIMRGCAPLITSIVMLCLGQPLSLASWGGVAILCGGILTLSLDNLKRHASLRGILISLRTSFIIAGYTLADGFGASKGGDGVAYACWIFFLNIFPLHIYVFVRHGRAYLPYLRQRGVIGIFGGLCGLGSYGIAIWAMTHAPIAMVAALRETSVIFGMLMAVVFLGEKLTLSRVAAVLLVCCGTMVLKYG
ncbi:DMT family transporter [uncultured Desulfovibrio sp.]|uniref:DMT family transporter n=1 Tax=Candidatus Desulfovibrio intestinavium TaxID=2838534 RepID=A0A9D2HNV3_9BACT|nr:DMT family transporter [uncultured Desulfovibrio sp.]HJA79652.1 DMT family transporter [Candidatus Desulfovibrio intestinavium]